MLGYCAQGIFILAKPHCQALSEQQKKNWVNNECARTQKFHFSS